MIEELLERYFEGETSAAEEKQIRAFFASGEVPEHLAAYAPLFAYFDEEIERDAEAQVGEPDLDPEPVSVRSALRTGSVQPFYLFSGVACFVYWLCWELPACCIPLIPVSVPTAMCDKRPLLYRYP